MPSLRNDVPCARGRSCGTVAGVFEEVQTRRRHGDACHSQSAIFLTIPDRSLYCFDIAVRSFATFPLWTEGFFIYFGMYRSEQKIQRERYTAREVRRQDRFRHNDVRVCLLYTCSELLFSFNLARLLFATG